MATYTPNYNLSKPDANDDFDAFRASYGDNMDKIDLNMGGGGGGGGGHTIVDPTGTDMPQESKLQFTGAVNVSDDAVNGQTVVDIEGGGNYYLNTIYSTEEKKIGYFVDGKPLYQKTVALNSLSVTNNQWARTNESATGIETIVDGFLIDNQSPSQTFQCDIGVDGGYIAVLTWFVGNSARTMSYLTFRYTKTTDTPELNPQTGGVIYLPTIYSEEEREIGCFVDGKPLYQKTISFGALPNSTSKSVAHGISDLDKIVSFSALAKRPEPFNIIPLPSSHYQSTSAQQEISFNATNITIRNGNNASAYTDVYVTLQYTKTTDVAGSGSWTPSGAKAVHYSTNEEVIGTWINGKPLYEKSFNLPSTITINNSSWTSTGVSISDIKNVVDGELNRNGLQKFACSLRAENSVIVIQTYFNGAQCNTDSVITVRYTKTTD